MRDAVERFPAYRGEPSGRPQPPAREPRAAREAAVVEQAVAWHLGWSLAAAVCLLGMVLAWRPPPPDLFAAWVAICLPGLFGPALRALPGEASRLALAAAWAVAGGFAAGATGGLGGPLGAFCAVPVLAAAAIDGRRLLSAATAFSLTAAAVAVFAGLTGMSAPPTEPFQIVAGSLAQALVIGGLGAAVTLALRRRAETTAGAQAAAERMEAILAAQPDLILTLDGQGRVGSAFGAAPPGAPVDLLYAEGVVGAAWHPDRAAVQTALYRAFREGRAETPFTPRTAMDRHLVLALRRIDDERLVGVIRDDTVRHAREASLEAARAEAEALNAGKSRFLANMSHELRTPLNAVIGFSDIMRQRLFGPLPDKYQEYAQLIHESGGHLLDLINDVLDMSKIEAERYELHVERFDAREPVSGALRLVRLQAHDADIALRGVLPADALTVSADRRALKQITLNLLSNAMKFTPSGGSVTVTLRAEGPVMELVVADTGVGIAPEDVKRLGRPFEQAGDASQRSRGTGLGLSLVRAFAELHGGTMGIESTLGEGTAVTVRMPVVEVRDEEPPHPGAQIIPLNAQR